MLYWLSSHTILLYFRVFYTYAHSATHTLLYVKTYRLYIAGRPVSISFSVVLMMYAFHNKRKKKERKSSIKP